MLTYFVNNMRLLPPTNVHTRATLTFTTCCTSHEPLLHTPLIPPFTAIFRTHESHAADGALMYACKVYVCKRPGLN